MEREGRGHLGARPPGKGHLAVVSFLFAAKTEAKRARRFDAAAADQGFALDPSAATLRRPTHRAGAR